MRADNTKRDERQVRLGKYLKKHRKKSGVHQKEIASMLGLHEVQISRIENGHTGTSKENIERYCEAVGADKYEAFRILDITPPISSIPKNTEHKIGLIFDESRQLSPEQQERLDTILDMVLAEVRRFKAEKQIE
ncbi:MAG TPA: helix-turn-helix transcriptional regulator [Blastocatellia bacterium]|nr:helix-turn-helix transcriptional regulator [Blastocatellia bacterium]